ncbi:MAG: thiamine pyrophosphate-binding protein, partial [Burkholderiales bacterium]
MNEPMRHGTIAHDAPVPSKPGDEFWGSDYIAAVVREMDIPYIALVPGSSYRGFHDSIVNYLGNRAPQMVLTIHEENAVAIAHGYAKAADRMMACAVHANIGLMRAVMAVYNAWCDRAPILMFGATGPWDAAQRRAWIDWIHTSADQGGLIRNFTKWDNQPGSPLAAGEAILRAAQIATTAPRGPVY